MKKLNNILWGIVLIAVGVIFGLNALEITDIEVFFDGWWTLFIIIPCFVGIFTTHERTGNLIGFLVGVALLLACRDILSLSLLWKLLIPAIIVIIGLKLIFKDAFSFKSRKVQKQILEENGKLPEYCATFSGQNLDFANQEFTGAELTAVFGGIKCDLRNAIFKGDTVINICSVFGGVDILLPAHVNVKITSSSIFGGISNDHKTNPVPTVPTVYVNGSCIFGGAEVK